MIYNIIANSDRVSAKKLNDIRKIFEQNGKECRIWLAERAGQAAEIAARLSSGEEKCAIIVCGGDGTLHNVLNAIKDFEKVNLGLIPAGTGNDFAKAAGIPKNYKRAARVIACATPSFIDFIELSSGLKSINAVGMGIDVDVLKRAYQKQRGGKSNYLSALIYCLKRFKSYNFTVTYDGITQKHFGLIAALGNGIQIGGGIKLFPDAKLSDGYMNLLIVDYISRFKTIFAFLKLMRGKINSIKQVTVAKIKQATFIPEKPCNIQAEGEIYEDMVIDAHIVSGKLKFYLPAAGKCAK